MFSLARARENRGEKIYNTFEIAELQQTEIECFQREKQKKKKNEPRKENKNWLKKEKNNKIKS